MANTWLCRILHGITILMLTIGPCSGAATGSDVGKEQRWAAQIVDSLLDGEALWLSDDAGHEVLGILTEGSVRQQAVILVHGIGVHPNWPDVIFPLREGLLEADITSLSIQMPVLANDADSSEYLPLFPEAAARLKSAVRYLLASGYAQVSLVAHSLGAAMSVHALSAAEPLELGAVILIGMGPGENGETNIEAMATVKAPVLDLSGSEDLPLVRESAKRRARAGETGQSPWFQQIIVQGADHFFQGHEEALILNTLNWLKR